MIGEQVVPVIVQRNPNAHDFSKAAVHRCFTI